MARKIASFRLDVELLDWVTSYARSRGTSQAVVVESALRSLREDSANGVPDLPAADAKAVRRGRAERAAPGLVRPASQVVAPDPHALVMGARQAKLNAAADRARGKS